MIAIDNTELKNYCRNCNCTNVAPGASYAYDATEETVTVTDTGTIGSPDGLSIMHVNVHDQFGNQVYGKIEVAAGNVVIDVSDLDVSKPLSITVTLVSNGGCVSDGIAKNIQAAGNIGGWDTGFSAASAMTPISPEPEPDPIPTSDVDKTDLQAKVDEVIGLTEADYTPATWAAVETAMLDSVDVLSDETATQQVVDDSLTALTNAVSALVTV